MTTGKQLATFINGLNAEADIDVTLLTVLVDTAKTILEGERPWVALRRTNTSKTLTGNTEGQTVDISDITDLQSFFSEYPIRLYDGDNRIDWFQQIPFDRRLDYKDVSNTFCYDKYNETLYFNGKVAFSGTLYLNYIAETANIDLESESDVWTQFPARFLPLLGFYAVGIFKGAVDYDSINRQMLPENRETMRALKMAMEKWDDDLQQNEMEHNDPTNYLGGGFHRNGAIDRYHA